MPRVSYEQARANRAAMVEAASRLLREGGPCAVTVEGVSARAGMTRGSFYKQFASREALLDEALEHAREERRAAMATAGRQPGRTTTSFAAAYLSRQHRDSAGDGCVVAALSGHVASGTNDSLKDGYRRAFDDMLAALSALAPNGDEQQVLVDAALLVGALQLARATAGSQLSDAILEAASRALLGQRTTAG